MDVPTSPIGKSPDPDTAEEICELLEQTILKYFPQERKDIGRPSSCPLIPHRQEASDLE